MATPKLMPMPTAMENDIDAPVWVWNALETSWQRTTSFAAGAFHKTWPNRYTHWLPDVALAAPVAQTTN